MENEKEYNHHIKAVLASSVQFYPFITARSKLYKQASLTTNNCKGCSAGNGAEFFFIFTGTFASSSDCFPSPSSAYFFLLICRLDLLFYKIIAHSWKYFNQHLQNIRVGWIDCFEQWHWENVSSKLFKASSDF